MKQKQTYYRRKEGKIIAEGKMKGKTIFLFTVPDVESILKPSFFKREKIDKIMEKIKRLDNRPEKKKVNTAKVHPIKIIRTSEKDEKKEQDREKLNEMMKNDFK
jgi:hypothetical protein|tara:strand:+ start:4270 stop:4581 length:312 start_codon:yes stop_codon:yes gene_type:complete